MHQLINWLNKYREFEQLELLPLDVSNLSSNAWLAGFSDCDSNFLISYTYDSVEAKAKDIHLRYRLSQRQNYHRSSDLGISYLPIISNIGETFKGKTKSYNRNRINKKNNTNFIELGYLVTITSLAARTELIQYFSKFPLLSSKHLDFINWAEAHELVVSKKYKSLEGTAKLVELKNSMNSKRTQFNWEHLIAVDLK